MEDGDFLKGAVMDSPDGKKWVDGMPEDLYRFQCEIDALPPEEYVRFRKSGIGLSEADKMAFFARYPALKRYDEAYDKVFRDVAQTEVTGTKPAVWYVYNMGVVVKTQKTIFTIDLAHRQDILSVPIVDFACITHNHDDHYSRATLKALDKAGKTVFNNFSGNYGAYRAGAVGGYTKRGRTYRIKDVAITTHVMSHNYYLQDFTTAFEIAIGDYVIYHTGDSGFIHEMRPNRPNPDLWIVSPYNYIDPVDAARQVRAKRMVFGHLQELGHAIGGGARSTWGRGYEGAARVRELGLNAVVPVWGERIDG